MLSVGRERVAGVRWLKEVVRGASKSNKGRGDAIISLCEGGALAKVKTAEAFGEQARAEDTHE